MMNSTAIATESAPTWRDVLAGERENEYFQALLKFVETERASGKIIYPPNDKVFNAIASTPFASVRVVIVGQDPYIGPEQAHGLSFSVPRGVPKPPSLINIFKEISSDLGVTAPDHGCLEAWAKQGVLLLNAVLTVEAGCSGSHANRGWERFTDRIIRELNDRRQHLVFLLWGSYAAKKCEHVDRSRHCVLSAPHPSPLSAHRGFLGCKHFSQANRYLSEHDLGQIAWGDL